MSNSAGTLQTTHQATYIPPRMMPGYKGHCPTAKFDYGETYGNATAKYFQDYRSETLNQSKSSYAKGGQFPTVYTHNPDLVIHARDRSREQWRTAPKYELTNVNHDRREEINKFDTLAQGHRQFYKDRTGTVPRVDDFLIPKSAEDMYRQDIKSGEEQVSIASQAKMTKMLNKPVMRTPKTASSTSRSSTVRDRAMRDVVFESR
ncbi:protein FAM166C A-like [Asterias rubens]|uniref:protein FAM166C A-like n=1 Tax=Asterias rubens TaxID=7604 RepID=UPI001454ED66|nr:protein FAM166C A-like [Asterias rubens]